MTKKLSVCFWESVNVCGNGSHLKTRRGLFDLNVHLRVMKVHSWNRSQLVRDNLRLRPWCVALSLCENGTISPTATRWRWLYFFKFTRLFFKKGFELVGSHTWFTIYDEYNEYKSKGIVEYIHNWALRCGKSDQILQKQLWYDSSSASLHFGLVV
jgi:hypothetical protein